MRNVAVSAQEGEATFHVAENVEQMSTLNLTASHQDWIGKVGGTVTAITVPTKTMDALLDDAGFPRIDFVTIDVEGHEMDVLRGFSLEKHRPRVLIIEENSGKGESDVARHLRDQGYVNFKRTGVNDWYAQESDGTLVQPEAVRQFLREQAMRRFVDRLKAQVAARLGVMLKRKVGP